MKKFTAFILAAALFVAAFSIGQAARAEGSFTTNGTVLTAYAGSDENVVIPDGITEIGEYAFLESTAMRTVTIPSTVTKISTKAFADCISLKTVNIPGSVSEISDDAFFGCSSMTSAVLGEGVTNIGDSAFCGCLYLREVTLPSTLRHIGELAFCDTALEKIDIPAGVTSIRRDAFFGCNYLKSINVSADNAVYAGAGGMLLSKSKRTVWQYPVPGSSYVATANTGRVSVLFPSSVKKVILPSSVKYMSRIFEYDAGSKAANIAVYTPKNSYTAKYMAKHGLLNTFTLKTYAELKAPSGLKAKAVKQSAKLTWKKRTGASAYHIWRRAGATGAYEKIATVSRRSSSYTDKKTPKGIKCYYRICATQKAGGKTVEAKLSGAVSVKVK